MPPVGFEPTISAGERPQTYALDRAATGTGTLDTTLANTDCLRLSTTSFILFLEPNKVTLGVKGAVCGPRGTHLAGRCVPVKIWEMPFIPAKSDACMSSS